MSTHCFLPGRVLLLAVCVACLPFSIWAAEKKAAPTKKKKAVADSSTATAPSLGPQWNLSDVERQRDFPSMCLDRSGAPWIAYIEHDGEADVLQLARQTSAGLEVVATVSERGVVHQPALAVDGVGGLWVFWGQLDEREIVTLRARRFHNGKLEPETTLAKSAASDTFADAATDAAGRVWVVWQSLRRGQGDIFARWFDPKNGKWSKELAISKPEGGNWEPRLAFEDPRSSEEGHSSGGAWVVFDSSRGGEFNLFLASVTLDGRVVEQRLTDSPEYEARARIAPDHQGKGFWITAERGRRGWGQDLRSHDGEDGLNGEKRIVLGFFDLDTRAFTEVPVPSEGRPAPKPALSVNLPVVATDTAGNPWICFRYYQQNRWQLAVTRFDAVSQSWAQPVEVPDSAFGQDRHSTLLRAGGRMLLCWASDQRTTKLPGLARVYLGQLEPPFVPMKAPAIKVARLPEPEPFLIPSTPERPRHERHTWTIGGKTYRLYFGDVHRHTDFSNCRTGQDGCVLEHFRYAYDMGALDFMGTSDHTDIAKRYDPYEWWQTQRLVDVFYAPGKFTSLYAYEREQRHPWGHRNIVFAQRGGPILYINRQLYRNSPWAERFPVRPGTDEITPLEVWELLKQYGKPVAAISHTGATSMGTDWDKYERIDGAIENVVEIFQGARVSYEGLGTPQPTVGLRKNEPYTPSGKAKAGFATPPQPITDFGTQFNTGVYQRALQNGHKLGVFASSDHVSTHTSFGGVYVEQFTREGIIEGLRARRTIAATDKIFVELSCDGQPLGSIMETRAQPVLRLAINGTAPLQRVTLVRNETNYQVFEPKGRDFQATFTDASPLTGENRYYLRIEQGDGNMAWSSPVWVQVRP